MNEMNEKLLESLRKFPHVESITFHSPSGDPTVDGENWTVVFFDHPQSQAVPLSAITAVQHALPVSAECEICSTWERDVQMNVWIPEARGETV
jgi:hypothetical protein